MAVSTVRRGSTTFWSTSTSHLTPAWLAKLLEPSDYREIKMEMHMAHQLHEALALSEHGEELTPARTFGRQSKAN